MASAEAPNGSNLDELIKIMSSIDAPGTDEVGEQLELVLEALPETMTQEQALFCFKLAEIGIKDTSVFRKLLAGAAKALLPPYLNKVGFMRALGLRDNEVSLPEISIRFNNLTKLKNGTIIFLKDTARWGKVNSVDGFSGSVGVNSIDGEGAFSAPLSLVLSQSCPFDPAPETLKLASFLKQTSFSGKDYLALAKRRSLLPMTDDEIKELAKASLVPSLFKAAEFEPWWKSSGSAGAKGKGRSASQARSVTELHVLLISELEEDKRITDDEVPKFKAFFEKLKPAVAMRDDRKVAECISMLTAMGEAEQLREIFEPLKGKVPFWPEKISRASTDALEIWGKIQVKHIEKISHAMDLIYSDEYLAAYATRLPLRCLNTFCEIIDDHLLYEAIRQLRTISCDILLWVWKNRKKHDEELLKIINIEKVGKALSAHDLPRAWVGAQRELKTQLMDKKDFHQQIIDVAGDEIWVITSVLQTAPFCSGSERQSLLVKLSRLSMPLREHLESGAGKKALGAEATKQASAVHEPIVTSLKSHAGLLAELDDIVNVQIPENRESLKAARAHGDFRENAEYDAAKERRNFLSRRRSELERDIMMVQPVDFGTMQVENNVIVGCTVDLKVDGKTETYYLLGAWDGNPDKNWLSYRTRLGKELMHKALGEKVKMPQGGEGEIAGISSLPQEVLDELAH
ncbi:GreA/GreB family elongation factor [Lentisphaerota bacterium]|nr:GreA/GreB family elongation factor [Lentisphaerota bacterium]